MEESRKSNSSKIIIAIIATVFLIGIGAGGMYIILKALPGTTVINKSEKEVTVNENGIADAVEKVYDSVVVVEVYKNNKLYATGTGFIFKKDGNKYYVMTNNHVVEDATSVKIRLTNDDKIETSLVGSDKYNDIGVLKFESDKDYSIANIGSSTNARVGDTVFAVGAPIDSSKYSWTVTRGILSGKDRLVSVSTTSNSYTADYLMKSLQTDAAINSGNSGGPLCNSNGEVIGITNMKLSASGIESMNFAIPIEDAMEYADKLINGGDVSRPTLGVNLAELYQSEILYYRYNIKVANNVEYGVIVTNVIDNTTASNAKLQAGDVITEINGQKITSIAEFKYELYKCKNGDKIKLKYNRDGKEKEVETTLEKYESANQ